VFNLEWSQVGNEEGKGGLKVWGRTRSYGDGTLNGGGKKRTGKRERKGGENKGKGEFDGGKGDQSVASLAPWEQASNP